jgi:hypothetical protein
MPFAAQARALWDRMAKGPTVLPSRVKIPDNRILPRAANPQLFSPNSSYFQVRINEMFLSSQRQWFSKIDPMVFILTEFTYDKSEHSVPFVVGPQLLENKGNPSRTPAGMLFFNTRVAGLHPYRGGRLTLSLVLCQIERENYAKRILGIVEKAAGALDFSTVLTSYVKLGGVILDGVDALLGLESTKPLIGMRDEIDPDAGDPFAPSHWLLLDLPKSEFREELLWVRDGHLQYGTSEENLSDFHKADYVLFSIVKSENRGDVRTLPFYSLFETALKEAASAETESWQRAKANLSALYQMLILSPDLTSEQADVLNDSFVNELKKARRIALQNATLGEPEDVPEDVQKRLHAAAMILDLK